MLDRFEMQSLEHASPAWKTLCEERREAFELLRRVFMEGDFGHMEMKENYVPFVTQDNMPERTGATLTQNRGALAAEAAAGDRALLQRILGGGAIVPPQGDWLAQRRGLV